MIKITGSADQFFKNEEHCYTALNDARKLFGIKTTTRKQYDLMQNILAFVYIYCPDNLRDLAFQTMNESEERRFYFEMSWLGATENDV